VRAALLVGALVAAFRPARKNARKKRAQERVERAAVVRPADAPFRPTLFPIASESPPRGDAARTRLVVDLSRPIEIAAFTLADPYSRVVDLRR